MFSGRIKKGFCSKCYRCKKMIPPEFIIPKRDYVKPKGRKQHYCNLCHGEGKCPLYKKVLVASVKASKW